MAAARQGTTQRGSGGWPPDIKPCLCVTMKSVLNAKHPLTASAYSPLLRFADRLRLGDTRLCVSALNTSTRSICSTRLKICYLLFVYFVYSVVQIFAFFAATVTMPNSENPVNPAL